MDHDAVSPPLTLAGKRVVLLLQGGGALGAYQVGAFAALDAACWQANTAIDWVGGISIGAVNAAVIAGPAGGDPSAELRRLWDNILAPEYPPYDFTRLWQSLPAPLRSGRLAALVPKYADWAWAAFNPFGQPHFFSSRVTDPSQNPWLAQWLRPLDTRELAFYDTGPLRATLDAHVDWNAINQAQVTRLSLGATRVRDGETVFFNSFVSVNPAYPHARIDAGAVLASGALPPGALVKPSAVPSLCARAAVPLGAAALLRNVRSVAVGPAPGGFPQLVNLNGDLRRRHAKAARQVRQVGNADREPNHAEHLGVLVETEQ